MNSLVIHTDGGARGNPGPAAVGVVLEYNGTQHTHARCLGTATNNVAEYTAVIDALELIPDFLASNQIRVENIAFYLDSQLIAYQIIGSYKVKESTLQLLHQKVHAALQRIGLPYTFNYVPRAQNKLADKLVNQALDANSPHV